MDRLRQDNGVRVEILRIIVPSFRFSAAVHPHPLAQLL